MNRLLVVSLALLVAACASGPDYKRPALEAPAAYKEAAGWKQAEPRDTELKGKWWELYGDPTLSALVEQVSVSNQNLARAEAQYRQALALVQSARSGYFPTVTGNASATRSRSASSSSSGAAGSSANRTSTRYDASLGASWEPDLWGRVRRSVESSQAGAQASAAELEAVRLSAQAELAQSYFELRVLDAQKRLLDDTVTGFQRSLQLTQNQYDAGVVARNDVIQAQTQLKSTQAQALDIGVRRQQLEHAIAVLVGKAPAELSIAPAPTAASWALSSELASVALPAIPTGLPSTLLERRPDIAAAERRMAAANAEIGVATAAFFPSLNLSGVLGLQSGSLASLLSAPALFWSIGPALAATLFDGGQRRAQKAAAEAGYDASVADYRQSVLAAFQEVEDNLVALRVLEQEAAIQAEAVAAARQSVELTTNQYKAGTVSFLNVVNVQATALAAERSALDILSRRLAASTALIRALGGGWQSAQLPAQN